MEDFEQLKIHDLIRGLEDDGRAAAAAELLTLGSHARAALLETALSRRPSPEQESPSSLRRRGGALELLAQMLLPRHCWRMLRPCLEESDAGIVTAAARIALKPGCGSLEDKRFAVQRLLELSTSGDAAVRGMIEDYLVSCYKDVRVYLEEEFTERHKTWDAEKGPDPMIPLLLRISRLADAKHDRKREG